MQEVHRKYWVVFMALLLCGCTGTPVEESSTSSESGEEGGTEGPGDGDTGGEVAVPPTWHGDVKAILAEHCWQCHQDGGIGPFNLTTHAEVEPMASFVLHSAEEGTMPPYYASTECIDYRDSHIPLAEDELETLAAWVEAGAPEGEPDDEAEPVVELPALDRQDALLELPAPYVPSPPPGELDEQRCFIMEWPFDKDVYVTGYHVMPGNEAIVHHAIAAIVPPESAAAADRAGEAHPEAGYPCGQLSIFDFDGGEAAGGPNNGTGLAGIFLGGLGHLFDKMQGQGLLALWAPGGGAARMPEGTGVLVRAGSRILLNTHYNLANTGPDPEPDLTRVAFMVEEEVEKPGVTMLWTDPAWLGGEMHIPANDDSVDFSWEFPLSPVLLDGEPLHLYTASVHMHYLGQSGNMTLKHPDGTETCLLDVPDYDFDWQRAYEFVDPILVQPEDSLRLSCRFDNSASNQPVLGGVQIPSQEVYWGDNTTDEMCLGFFFMTR